MLKNTSETFGSVSRFFHWVLAGLVIVMLAIGFFLDNIGSPLVYQLHKLTGLFIFCLAVLSILWQRFNVHPAYPETMPHWHRYLAQSGQYLILLCVLIMPLTGWFFSTAGGKAPMLGNLTIAMPFVDLHSEWSKTAKMLHKTVDYVLIGLICIHILAAFAHQFYLKDNLMKRMIKD